MTEVGRERRVVPPGDRSRKPSVATAECDLDRNLGRSAVDSTTPAIPVEVCEEAGEDRRSELVIRFTAMDGHRVPHLLAIARAALKKYSERSIHREVESIKIANDVWLGDSKVAGCYSTRTRDVYVAATGAWEFDDMAFESTIHEEISSLLLAQHAEFFDVDEWKSQCPNDFEYGSGGLNAIRNGTASQKPSMDLWRQGFLHEYAKASIEEDFNSIAGQLWTGDFQFHELNSDAMRSYRRVFEKGRMAMDFYSKLCPKWDVAFFRYLRPASDK